MTLGLLTRPGQAGTTRVAEIGADDVPAGKVPLRPLEIGVCGTDREISEGLFGVAPEGGELVLMKGAGAPGEITAAEKAIRKYKLRDVEVLVLGEGILSEETRVIRATVG